MTKNQLRLSITEMESLCSKWVKFRNYFYPETLTPELESEFSQLKSDLTSMHHTLLSLVEFDIEIARIMLENLGRITSPHGAEQLTVTAQKSLEDDWNNAYLLIQETMGLLEYRLEEKSQLLSPSSIFRRMSNKKPVQESERTITYMTGKSLKRRGLPPIVKLIFVLVVLGIIIGILWQLNIIQDYLPI